MPTEAVVLIAVGVTAVVFVVVIGNARIRSGRTTRTDAPSGPPADADHEITDRLSRLADLRSKGLLDEHEYETERRRILGEL